MSRYIEFHLRKPGTGGFTMPGEVQTADGKTVSNPQGKEMVTHLKSTIERVKPFTWPSGVDFLRFDSENEYDKKMITYLENGTRCEGRVGPIKTVTYYKRDVEKEILEAAMATARAADLHQKLPEYIGSLDKATDNEEKIRSFALAIGINGHDTMSVIELWGLCVSHIAMNPVAVEKAMKESGDNLFKARLDKFKVLGMLEVVDGNAIFFANRKMKDDGTPGVNLGKYAAFFNKVKFQKNKEAVDLWQQLLNAEKDWETTA